MFSVPQKILLTFPSLVARFAIENRVPVAPKHTVKRPGAVSGGVGGGRRDEPKGMSA